MEPPQEWTALGVNNICCIAFHSRDCRWIFSWVEICVSISIYMYEQMREACHVNGWYCIHHLIFPCTWNKKKKRTILFICNDAPYQASSDSFIVIFMGQWGKKLLLSFIYHTIVYRCIFWHEHTYLSIYGMHYMLSNMFIKVYYEECAIILIL